MIQEERPVSDRLDGITVPAETPHLAGHRAALDGLAERYAKGRLHHALLVTGPRGIGKATFAFHAARHLLSHPDHRTAPPDSTSFPVSEPVRRQVANGSHPNLLHMARPWDEKGKRFKTQLSIDEVRRTRAFFSMSAGAAGLRIAVVDTADDMNGPSANALLKILEEPPARSLLLVLSNSPGGLLPTIRSRCEVLRLDTVADEEIATLLPKLDETIPAKAVPDLVELAGGSPRLALQLSQGKVMADFRAFRDMVANGADGNAADWVIAHRIASAIAPVARADDHALFLRMAIDWIAVYGRQIAMQRANLGAVAGWAEVWEGLREATRLADSYNLDRKQVVLNLFADIFQQNRRHSKAA